MQPFGEGARGQAGSTGNEQIYSTLIPEFTEMLPTATERSPLLQPQRYSASALPFPLSKDPQFFSPDPLVSYLAG